LRDSALDQNLLQIQISVQNALLVAAQLQARTIRANTSNAVLELKSLSDELVTQISQETVF
jgi:hypothetical protein